MGLISPQGKLIQTDIFLKIPDRSAKAQKAHMLAWFYVSHNWLIYDKSAQQHKCFVNYPEIIW